jgi:hypothetical protein
MTIIVVTTTKPSTSVEFYQDLDVMNYVLNEYVLPSKLVSTTRTSDDGLSTNTTLKFTTTKDYEEFRNDPVIKNFGMAKQVYNIKNNIVSHSMVPNEQNS